MKFAVLKKFMEECHNKGVELPNGMTIIIDDFEENVPDPYTEQGAIEYNHLHGDKYSTRVEIRSARKVEKGFELQRG